MPGHSVYALVNKKASPLLPTGEWSVPALRVAAALNEMPEVLFAEDRLEAEAIAGSMRLEMIGETTSIARAEALHDLRVLLKGRTEREVEVLYSRFGIGMTLFEVGQEHGVTRERIRQIENKALRNTRNRISKQEARRRERTNTIEYEWKRARAMAEVERKKWLLHEAEPAKAKVSLAKTNEITKPAQNRTDAERMQKLEQARARWAAMEEARKIQEAECRYLSIIAKAKAAKDAVLRQCGHEVADAWFAANGYPAGFERSN